jgi:ferritin-like metal-binding protein YciE
MAQITTLHDLFITKLQKVYDVEQQIIEALPRMIDAATNSDLKKGLEMHLEQTRDQVERLEQIGQELGTEITGEPCPSMSALIAEGEETLSQIEDPEVRDAAIIVSAQEVEHHEIAAYGSLVAHATVMGHTTVVPLLEESLAEEEETDEELSMLAEAQANPEAL